MRFIHLVMIGFGLSLATQSAHASLVLTLQGKVDSITEKHFLIETKKSIFYVKKKSLAKNQQRQLASAGSSVSIAVPVEAIDQVQLKRK